LALVRPALEQSARPDRLCIVAEPASCVPC